VPLRSRARFPDVPLDRPHYESFYIKASHPGGGLGLWLRHTVLKAPGERPRGALWLTLFDRASTGPVGLKASYPHERVSAPEPSYIRIGEASLEPGVASGSLEAGSHGHARWALRFQEGPPAFHYLPRMWMYEGRLPRTKALSLYPAVAFSGTVSVGTRALELEAWPGMIGHNWGSEHAQRSSWLHATAFAEQPEARLDVVLARVRLGPVLTPWIANGCLWLDGRGHRLGGLRPGAASFREGSFGASFELRGAGVALAGEVEAPAEQFAAWRYGHPDGGWHPTLNCSVADLRLRVRGGASAERPLHARGTAAYEIQLAPGAQTTVPLQPFGDP